MWLHSRVENIEIPFFTGTDFDLVYQEYQHIVEKISLTFTRDISKVSCYFVKILIGTSNEFEPNVSKLQLR